MALVTLAPRAMVFGPRQNELPVALGFQAVLDGRVEARPPGAALVLGAGIEERQVAGGADKGAGSLFIVQGAAAWPLGRFLEQHIVRCRREERAPLLQRLLQLRHALAQQPHGRGHSHGDAADHRGEKASSVHDALLRVRRVDRGASVSGHGAADLSWGECRTIRPCMRGWTRHARPRTTCAIGQQGTHRRGYDWRTRRRT